MPTGISYNLSCDKQVSKQNEDRFVPTDRSSGNPWERIRLGLNVDINCSSKTVTPY